MSFVQRMLFDPLIPAYERRAALHRARSDPGTPNPACPTPPFWLKHPHLRLAKMKSASLPTEADVVVIGSGITSASIVRSLLHSSQSDTRTPVPKIVVLEARDLCSGATGRNGGHILETVEEFEDLSQTVGLEAAKKITRMRLSHLSILTKAAEELGLVEEAQVRQVEFLSTYFDEARWRAAVKSIRLFKEAMPTESAEWRIIPKHQIPKDYSLPCAVGVIAGPAGALWPYKFVTGVLARMLEQYPNKLTIETNTPVTAVQQVFNHGAKSYEVVTSRGSIYCRHVVHCTNAHVAHLVPRLRGCIYPIRGHMSAQSPPDDLRSQGHCHSWLFNYAVGFDYLTQLPMGPHSTNEMMLGGGFAQSEYGGIQDIGIGTDDALDQAAEKHLSKSLGVAFGSKDIGNGSADKIKSIWTGNMGFSADGFPWVGLLPASCTNHDRSFNRDCDDDQTLYDRCGREWVCAGFSGEGMVHAWQCGTALAQMLSLHDAGLAHTVHTSLSWFPEQMLVTEERMKRSVLPQNIPEALVIG